MNKNDNKRKKYNKKASLKFKEFKVKEHCLLLDFLLSKYPSLSRNNVKHLLSGRYVSVSGAIVTQFNLELNKEDVVVVFDHPIRQAIRPSRLPVIYEDEEIIVIDKPAGLLSVENDKEKRATAFRLVNDYLQAKDKHNRIYVTHRLDEDTSGILLFSKNSRIKDALQKDWSTLVKKRGYYALVEGTFKEKSGSIVNYLKENKLNLMYITDDKFHGKKCITNYQVIRENESYSLLDVNIETGRKNQIRVQLGHLNHYVVGDDKYGNPSNPINRLGLHAYELDIVHPFTHKLMKFRSKMPKEFLTLFKR